MSIEATVPGCTGCATTAGINGCARHGPHAKGYATGFVPMPTPAPGPFWCPDCGGWWAGYWHNCDQSRARAEQREAE